jgi:membrane protease subunit HflK
MEQVLGGANKVVIEPNASGAGGVVPYLPLPALRSAPAPDTSSSSTQPTTTVTTGN